MGRRAGAKDVDYETLVRMIAALRGVRVEVDGTYVTLVFPEGTQPIGNSRYRSFNNWREAHGIIRMMKKD